MGHSLITPNTITEKDRQVRSRSTQRTGLRRAAWARPARKGAGESIVVIGAGMAGHKFCERLVALVGGGTSDITLIGEEPCPAYDRVNLNRLFNGAAPESLQLASREWYAENGVRLITGDPVVLIERYDQQVITQSNREIHYDKLILATGSRARIPEIEISCPDRVHVYRTLADLEAIIQHAGHAGSVAVIGGGLLGVEAAKGLNDLGLETTIVDYSSGLLAKHLSPEASGIFNRNFSRLGMEVRTQWESQSISEQDGKAHIGFTNGKSLDVDFVVVAIGVRPRDELAGQSGLDLGPRGGVKVNHQLQTSDPNIFAIGECASYQGVTYGLAAPGFMMADVLAERINGKRRRFQGVETTCTLKVPDCPMHAVGEYQHEGRAYTFSNETEFRQLVCDGSRLVGATVVGEWTELPRVQEAITSRRRLRDRQIEQFKQTGLLWPNDPSDEVAQWPPRAVVCNCMRIERGALTKAVAGGCTSVEQLSSKTGASTVCGSCKPLLAQLVGVPPSAVSASGWKPFLIASIAAVMVVLILLLVPAIPAAETVQGGWTFEMLWRDPFWKKATGFTMLGLIVASALISLRKRIRWIRLGDFGWWRFAHGLLGTLCLVVLVTHTGLSLGQNLNLVLMLNFLTLALWGGLAGAVTALEHRYTGYVGRRVRQVWTWIHIALVWPLPALIAFHIISVYWY